MMEPTKHYRGPVRAIEPTYSYPYRIEVHCPSCGSMKVMKHGLEGRSRTKYRCKDCGRYFIRKDYDLDKYDINESNRYKLKGGMVRDEDKEYRYKDLDDAVWGEIMDHSNSDNSLSELAESYYGDYYSDTMDEFEPDWETNLNLQLDIPWAEKDHALKRYVNELGVGESYRMPDVDLEIIRSRNLLGGKYAQRRKALKFWEGRR